VPCCFRVRSKYDIQRPLANGTMFIIYAFNERNSETQHLLILCSSSSSSVDRWTHGPLCPTRCISLRISYSQNTVHVIRTSTQHYYDLRCTIYRPSRYNEPLGFPKIYPDVLLSVFRSCRYKNSFPRARVRRQPKTGVLVIEPRRQ